MRTVAFLKLLCRGVSRGGRACYPRTWGTGHTQTSRKVCDMRTVAFLNLPYREVSRGGRDSYPRMVGTGRTRASRKALCDMRTVVLWTALSGRFLRRTRLLSADEWNRTHTGIAEGALRHMRCQNYPVGTVLTRVPLPSSRGCSAWKASPPIQRTIHIRRAIIGQKAHG